MSFVGLIYPLASTFGLLYHSRAEVAVPSLQSSRLCNVDWPQIGSSNNLIVQILLLLCGIGHFQVLLFNAEVASVSMSQTELEVNMLLAEKPIDLQVSQTSFVQCLAASSV